MNLVNSAILELSPEQIWEMSKDELISELGERVVHAWLGNITVQGLLNGTLFLNASNDLAKSWVEKNYLPSILQTLQTLRSDIGAVQISVPQAMPEVQPQFVKPQVARPEIRKKRSVAQGIWKDAPRFDDYQVSQGNRTAWTAAQATANPTQGQQGVLLLYGNSAVGKTHLLQAIGREAIRNGHFAHIQYMTAEEFLKLFMLGFKEKEFDRLTKRFEECDLLLMDDLHLLAKKDKTQLALAQVIQRLLSRQVRMVFTADRPLQEFKNFQPRLLSQLQTGIACELAPADLSLRVSLYQAACAKLQIQSLTQESLQLLAVEPLDARAIYGRMLRLQAQEELLGVVSPTESLANSSFGNGERKPKITLAILADLVAVRFGVQTALLASPGRMASLALPRKITMCLARELTDCSLEEIGAFFNRDYSTVIASLNALRKQMEKDSTIVTTMQELRQHLQV